jgi:hypothetical protein
MERNDRGRYLQQINKGKQLQAVYILLASRFKYNNKSGTKKQKLLLKYYESAKFKKWKAGNERVIVVNRKLKDAGINVKEL